MSGQQHLRGMSMLLPATRDASNSTRVGARNLLTDLTAEQVRHLFSYNPETGVMLWKNLTHSNSRAALGSIAGANGRNGYRIVRIRGRSYFLHRLAWLHAYGEWPIQAIDHIDGNTSNNAIANLRQAVDGINQRNRQVRGFWRDPRNGKFRAAIRINHKLLHLGMFETEALAQAAYAAARENLGSFVSLAEVN